MLQMGRKVYRVNVVRKSVIISKKTEIGVRTLLNITSSKRDAGNRISLLVQYNKAEYERNMEKHCRLQR